MEDIILFILIHTNVADYKRRRYVPPLQITGLASSISQPNLQDGKITLSTNRVKSQSTWNKFTINQIIFEDTLQLHHPWYLLFPHSDWNGIFNPPATTGMNILDPPATITQVYVEISMYGVNIKTNMRSRQLIRPTCLLIIFQTLILYTPNITMSPSKFYQRFLRTSLPALFNPKWSTEHDRGGGS